MDGGLSLFYFGLLAYLSLLRFRIVLTQSLLLLNSLQSLFIDSMLGLEVSAIVKC